MHGQQNIEISLSCRLQYEGPHMNEGSSRIASLSYRHPTSCSAVMVAHTFNPPPFKEGKDHFHFHKAPATFPFAS